MIAEKLGAAAHNGYRLHGQDRVKIERPVPLLNDRARMVREFFLALK